MKRWFNINPPKPFALKKVILKKIRSMIAELKEVIHKVEQLDASEQLQIAKMLKEELQWNETLNNTQDKLSILAKEALHEYKSGKTKQQDW